MSRKMIAIAAALSLLAVGSPLITANANPLARQYYDQGFDKYDAGNYQGATDDYTKTIEGAREHVVDALGCSHAIEMLGFL